MLVTQRLTEVAGKRIISSYVGRLTLANVRNVRRICCRRLRSDHSFRDDLRLRRHDGRTVDHSRLRGDDGRTRNHAGCANDVAGQGVALLHDRCRGRDVGRCRRVGSRCDVAWRGVTRRATEHRPVAAIAAIGRRLGREVSLIRTVASFDRRTRLCGLGGVSNQEAAQQGGDGKSTGEIA